MSRQPNILIVCTDQQRTDSLSCYEGGVLETPGFDKIACDGVLFLNAYCPSALCTPSRVSLLSGQYVNRHKIWSIGINTGDDVPMLQHYLGDSGYKTALVGKAHLEAYTASREESQESVVGWEKGYGDWAGPYYGFDEVRLALGHGNYGMTGHYGAWLRSHYSEEQISGFKSMRQVSEHPPFGGEAYRSSLPLKHHNSVWTVDSAIEFFQKHDRTQPFFMFLSFQDPHHPHVLPEDFELPLDSATMSAPAFVEGELDDKPPHFKLAHTGQLENSRFTGGRFSISGQGSGYDYRQVQESAALEGRCHYYSMVSLIDSQLQRLWQFLEQSGLYEDTLIIVTSDHGELLGDHGIWMKGPFHYQPLINVPLLAKPARSVPFHGPGLVADVVSLVDVVPTCLSVSGVSKPTAALDGQNLFNIPYKPDRAVLVETVQDWNSLVCKTVVTTEHKLTWYADETFGELYDLLWDTQERRNFWSDRRYEGIKSSLLSKLLNLETHAGASSKERISYA